MTLNGKGLYIWNVANCEGGNPEAIANKAQQSGLTHVLIKVADNRYPHNIVNGRDLARETVNALRNRRIQAWGWQYVYGDDPAGEARIAVERTRALRLDGFIVDAEREYKRKYTAARQYMAALRNGLPNTPIALSSYRYPSYHRELPWAAFLEKCDYNMPQVYWEMAHNPDKQLKRTVAEFSDTRLVGFRRPIIPTGAAYGHGAWVPTAADITLFLKTSVELGQSAANLYSWDWSTSRGNHHLFDAIANFNWPGSPPSGGTPVTPPPPTTDPDVEPLDPIDVNDPGDPGDSEFNVNTLLGRMLTALNSSDIEGLISLYHANAGHVNFKRIVIGHNSLREWYNQLLFQDLPNATFNIGKPTGNGRSWTYRWTANSPAGQVRNGEDTIGIRDGLIQYHYTSFMKT